MTGWSERTLVVNTNIFRLTLYRRAALTPLFSLLSWSVGGTDTTQKKLHSKPKFPAKSLLLLLFTGPSSRSSVSFPFFPPSLIGSPLSTLPQQSSFSLFYFLFISHEIFFPHSLFSFKTTHTTSTTTTNEIKSPSLHVWNRIGTCKLKRSFITHEYIHRGGFVVFCIFSTRLFDVNWWWCGFPTLADRGI